jgi:hypothetical protein
LVAIPSSAVKSIDLTQSETLSGDDEAFSRLTSYLDTEVVGFYMHQR